MLRFLRRIQKWLKKMKNKIDPQSKLRVPQKFFNTVGCLYSNRPPPLVVEQGMEGGGGGAELCILAHFRSWPMPLASASRVFVCVHQGSGIGKNADGIATPLMHRKIGQSTGQIVQAPPKPMAPKPKPQPIAPPTKKPTKRLRGRPCEVGSRLMWSTCLGTLWGCNLGSVAMCGDVWLVVALCGPVCG